MGKCLTSIALLLACSACTPWASARSQKATHQYAVAPAEAHRLLSRTDIPDLVFGSGEADFEVIASGPDRVTWIAKQGGGELFRYVALLRPVEPSSTEVELTVTGATTGPSGNVERRLAEKPEIRGMYLAAMEEQVASTLDGRPFDMIKLHPAMRKVGVANYASILKSMKDGAERARLERKATLARAYEDEAAGRWP